MEDYAANTVSTNAQAWIHTWIHEHVCTHYEQKNTFNLACAVKYTWTDTHQQKTHNHVHMHTHTHRLLLQKANKKALGLCRLFFLALSSCPDPVVSLGADIFTWRALTDRDWMFSGHCLVSQCLVPSYAKLACTSLTLSWASLLLTTGEVRQLDESRGRKHTHEMRFKKIFKSRKWLWTSLIESGDSM